MLYRVFKNKCRRPSLCYNRYLIYILGLARFCRVAKLFLLISNFMSMYYNIKENMKTGSREFHDKAISTVQQENQRSSPLPPSLEKALLYGGH